VLVDSVSAMGADVIVVGAGLAVLVATGELVDRGNTVLVVEQENPANLDRQAL
jgi:predicted oxidoreductase